MPPGLLICRPGVWRRASVSFINKYYNVNVSHKFIKITWDEVDGRVGINRGRKAPYFTRYFDGFPALIPWFSTVSMVSLIPSFITYRY
jgi:hypothetical protein